VGVDVEYDPAKNEKNIRERGLSFECVREFDFATTISKSVYRNGEVRWLVLRPDDFVAWQRSEYLGLASETWETTNLCIHCINQRGKIRIIRPYLKTRGLAHMSQYASPKNSPRMRGRCEEFSKSYSDLVCLNGWGLQWTDAPQNFAETDAAGFSYCEPSSTAFRCAYGSRR